LEKTEKRQGRASLGAGLGTAVPGAPCVSPAGSAAHWPLSQGQAALLQGKRRPGQTPWASVPAGDPSPSVLPLPLYLQ